MFSPALGSFVTTAVWLTAPWTSHALHQGLRSPEPLLRGLTAVHSGQTRECIAFISRQVYGRKKHLDVWNHNSHDASDIRGCTHHFIHLSQSVPPILPVSKNFLSKVNNGQLHTKMDIFWKCSEEDMLPNGKIFHLGWRETCYQLHLKTGMV